MALKPAGSIWWSIRAWFVMVVIFCAGGAFATPLPYQDTKGKYSLEISARDEEIVVFELKGASDVSTASVFSMSKPERIIVDLPTGRSLNWFRNIVVQRGIVQRVRIGSHAAKVRFVLDLSRASKGAYEVSNKAGVLRVTVKAPEKKGSSSVKDLARTSPEGVASVDTASGDTASVDTTGRGGVTVKKKPETLEIIATSTPVTVNSPAPTRTPKPTQTPKPIRTVKPTHTFTPTNIAKPTRTSVVRPVVSSGPVATPAPTDTPMPTATVELQPTETPIQTAIKAVQEQKSATEHAGSDRTEGKVNLFPTLASIEISPTPVAGQSNSDRTVKLLSLGYEMSDKGEPCLRLKFSRVVSYQMVRSSQDLFVVTVDNVALRDSSLSLAHFPPAAFSRFVSARAQSEKNGLKIFIYIENGSYLLSIPKGSEIWLKAYGGGNG